MPLSQAAPAEVLIVGGGHAGAQLALALRQHGFASSITVVGDEPFLPYHRPPLSKDYLGEGKTFEQILIRSPGAWEERQVSFRLGRRVVAVAPDQKKVTCDDGSEMAYGHLVWAAGGRPRRLQCPGEELAGVHVVRTRADVDRLAGELPVASRAVVIGGGYIGLETAAVLAGLGKQVVVLEAADRLLSRVAGADLSDFYEAQHRSRGVGIRTSAAVVKLNGTDGRVSSVELATGERLPADLVIVGIGIVPCVEPLIAAGAAGGNGVQVDGYCRTSLEDVYAIGDCAAHANAYAEDRVIRLESVQNANDQAAVVADAILGKPRTYNAVPWFWSNQFDLRLQTVGISTGHDTAVVRRHPEGNSLSVVYLKSGRVIALDCVNAARDYVHGRKLVVGRVRVCVEALASAADLKDVIA